MNIDSGSSIVRAVSNANPGSLAEEVSTTVLKKAEDSEASVALGLIQSLPRMPSALSPATEGKVGTQLNVFA